MNIDKDLLIKVFTGDDDAQYQLSVHYYKNDKTEKEAIFWLNRSIQKGNLKAIDLLQEINTKNYLLRRDVIKRYQPRNSKKRINKLGVSHANTCA